LDLQVQIVWETVDGQPGAFGARMEFAIGGFFIIACVAGSSSSSRRRRKRGEKAFVAAGSGGDTGVGGAKDMAWMGAATGAVFAEIVGDVFNGGIESGLGCVVQSYRTGRRCPDQTDAATHVTGTDDQDGALIKTVLARGCPLGSGRGSSISVSAGADEKGRGVGSGKVATVFRKELDFGLGLVGLGLGHN